MQRGRSLNARRRRRRRLDAAGREAPVEFGCTRSRFQIVLSFRASSGPAGFGERTTRRRRRRREKKIIVHKYRGRYLYNNNSNNISVYDARAYAATRLHLPPATAAAACPYGFLQKLVSLRFCVHRNYNARVYARVLLCTLYVTIVRRLYAV